MTTAYEVPLTSNPQQFSISLGGVFYVLLVTWNTVSESWTLDISDVDGAPIVQGIPLVTGVDLLRQFAYLGFTGALYVQSDSDLLRVPQFDDFGNDGHLYFVTSP